MDTTMVLLRLIHITCGIFWVGSDLLMLFFVEPAAVALGPTGGAFMQRLTGHTRYAQAMPISSLLTVISGILLLDRVSGGFDREWLSSTSGAVLAFGSLAGILAFFEGMTLVGPTVKRMEKLRQSMAEQGGPPSVEQLEQMARLQARSTHAYYLMILLTLLSIVGMSAARYTWF